jgi:hypothetical protein
MSTASSKCHPDQIRAFEEVTAPSVLRKRASIKGKTIQEAQKNFNFGFNLGFVSFISFAL